MYGTLLSSYSLFQALGAPYLGKLSDSIGRKKVLMISQAGTLLAWFIFGLSYFIPNTSIFGLALPLIVIAFSRVLDGITGGNNSVAQAYVVCLLKQFDFANEGNTRRGIISWILLDLSLIFSFFRIIYFRNRLRSRICIIEGKRKARDRANRSNMSLILP